MKSIPSAELIESAKAVLTARAESGRLRPIIRKIQTDLLYKFAVTDENGQPITEAENAWLMDERFVDKYYSALSMAYKDAGFDVPADCCPLLLAENAERQATRRMNEMAMELMPKSMRFDVSTIYDVNNYHRLTNLNLTYISQFF